MNAVERTPSRALLVDFGGVLTTSIRASFAAFCRTEGIERDAFIDAVFGDSDPATSPVARVEIGAIDTAAFDAELAARLSSSCGRTIDGAGLKERMFALVRPDERMRDAVRRARAAGVPTALVSNSWGLDGYHHEVEPLFDAMLVSGKVGLRKPEPGIYLAAAEAVGVDPEGCVFVDDLEHNVDGAAAVGMHGVLHREADVTIPILERALGM